MVAINKNKGIALIQVLIISIILTMLGIYINQTVRSQINVVNLMKSSFELNLKLEDAEALLLHALLTNKNYKKVESEIPLVQRWNFYGQPYQFSEDVIVKVQDISSLISLNHMNNKLATELFDLLGYSGHEVRTFLDSLADWKDKDDLKRLNGAERDYYRYLGIVGPRNGYLQSYDEVLNIQQSNILTMAQWQEHFSLALVTSFNPLNAPDLILKAFINNDDAYKEVIKKRQLGSLNELNFYQATGIEGDEFISFSTGRLLAVTIVVQTQNNKLSKHFIVDLRPRSLTRPVTISEITWNKV